MRIVESFADGDVPIDYFKAGALLVDWAVVSTKGKMNALVLIATGARVALPIFKPIIEAIWAEHIAPKAPLAGPSHEAQRMLADMPIDYMSGDPLNRPPPNNDGGGFTSFFGGNANAVGTGTGTGTGTDNIAFQHTA